MATKNPNDLSAQDPNTIATGDPRDAPYGGIHEGAAPPGAHQNPDGSWDWDTPATPPVSTATPAPAAPAAPTASGYAPPTATQQWGATVMSSDPRDAPYGGRHIGAAPPGAHQNPDGSWDWDTPSPAAPATPAAPAAPATPTAPTDTSATSTGSPVGSTTTGVQGSNPGGAISTTAPTGPPQTVNDVFRQSLLTQLQGPTPDQVAAGASDSGAVRAYNTTLARQYDRDRAQAAESAATGGYTGSGAQNTQQAGLNQQRAENAAAFTGQVSLQLMNARRQDLQNALTMAQSAGQFDAAQSLQQQLAQLDAAVTKRGQDLGLTEAQIQQATTERGQDLGLTAEQIQQATTERGQDIGATTAANQVAAQLQLGTGDLALRQALGERGLDVQQLGLELQNQQAMGQLGLGYQNESDAMNQYIADYLWRASQGTGGTTTATGGA